MPFLRLPWNALNNFNIVNTVLQNKVYNLVSGTVCFTGNFVYFFKEVRADSYAHYSVIIFAAFFDF